MVLFSSSPNPTNQTNPCQTHSRFAECHRSMTDESSIIPKYFQISRAIVNEIQQGNLAPGSPVLSENEIIAKYQVSNTTARKALLDLEQAGWVERIRGHGLDSPVGLG